MNADPTGCGYTSMQHITTLWWLYEYISLGGDKQSKIMRKLFVGGLNYETSEDDVGQYFKQFGPLQVCEYSN